MTPPRERCAGTEALKIQAPNGPFGGYSPGTLRLILTSVFAMTTSSFMAIPLLALYLQNEKRLAGWETATVLSINLLCTRALPILGGLVADRTNYGAAIVLGMGVRALGFVGLALFSTFTPLAIFAALVGLGGALYNPAVSGIFALLPEEIRRKSFTYFNQAVNAGVILGPALGGLLWHLGVTVPLMISASVIGLLALVTSFIDQLRIRNEGGETMLGDLKAVFRDTEFVLFLLGMSLFFIMFAQLYLSFPLECYRRVGSEALATSVFILNGVIGLATMFLVRNLLERSPPLSMVRLGVCLATIGMALVPVAASLPWMLVCVGIYSVGETLVLPASDMHIAESTLAQAKGTYFGAFELSMALGMTLGNYTGNFLMNDSTHPRFPWWTFAGMGLVLVIFLSWMIHRRQVRESSRSIAPTTHEQEIP